MIRADQTWDYENRDCEACVLSLVDALAFPTDSHIFEFCHETGAKIDDVVDLHLLAVGARRKSQGIISNMIPDPTQNHWRSI